jgi:class 3 adenylate cyclase
MAHQLDICGFTSLSATTRPLEIAQSVNMLFSEFDRAVTGRNLFKVDTIGDAYIIVGWLHRRHSQSETGDDASHACLPGMA